MYGSSIRVLWWARLLQGVRWLPAGDKGSALKIPFLDLKEVNSKYQSHLIEAASNVIKSGWYIGGNYLEKFESEFYVDNSFFISKKKLNKNRK